MAKYVNKKKLLPRLDCKQLKNGNVVLYLPIPDKYVELILGRNGETLRDLQEQAGVKINIYPGNRIVPLELREATLRICGKPHKCFVAKRLITDLISSVNHEVRTEQDSITESSESEAIEIAEPNGSSTINSQGCLSGCSGQNSVTVQIPSAYSCSKDSQQREILKKNESNISFKKPSCDFCEEGNHLLRNVTYFLETYLCKNHFKCRTCSRIFSSEKKFLSHLNKSYGKDCDRRYIAGGLNIAKEFTELNMKNGIQNSSKMRLTCDFCPKSIDLELTISDHCTTQQSRGNNPGLESLSRDNPDTAMSGPACALPSQNAYAAPSEACQSSVVHDNPSLHSLERSGSPAGPLADVPVLEISDDSQTNSSVTSNDKSSNNQKIFCEICSIHFPHLKHLRKHLKLVHQKDVNIEKSNQKESSRSHISHNSVYDRNTVGFGSSMHNKFSDSLSYRKYFNIKGKGQGKATSMVTDHRKPQNNHQSAVALDSVKCSSSGANEFNAKSAGKFTMSQRELESDKSVANARYNGSRCCTCSMLFADCVCSNDVQTLFVRDGNCETRAFGTRGSYDDVIKKPLVEVDLTEMEEESDLIEIEAQPNGTGRDITSSSESCVLHLPVHRDKTVYGARGERNCLTSQGGHSHFKSHAQFNEHNDRHSAMHISNYRCGRLANEHCQLDQHSRGDAKRRKVVEHLRHQT